MTDIYKLHDAAFANVSAFIVMHDNERVATIAFKFPRDGAGRLYVYVHWIGNEMVRGYAGGYGYDKRSAACASAARKVIAEHGRTIEEATPDKLARRQFWLALSRDGGNTWDSELRERGFTVYQAV